MIRTLFIAAAVASTVTAGAHAADSGRSVDRVCATLLRQSVTGMVAISDGDHKWVTCDHQDDGTSRTVVFDQAGGQSALFTSWRHERAERWTRDKPLH